MKLSELKLNPKNPQKFGDLSKLENSIKEFPKMMELRPLVYDSSTKYVIGGNKRLICLQNLGYKEIPDSWVRDADLLSEEEKERFVIADNVGFGEWDWDILHSDWDIKELDDWGLEVLGFDIDEDEFGDEFSLSDEDKSPFQQITFTLADGQFDEIKAALEEVKKTDEYKYVESMGNENTNGNAIYAIVKKWMETHN